MFLLQKNEESPAIHHGRQGFTFSNTFLKIIAHQRAMALQRYEENPKYPYFSKRNLIIVPHFVPPVPKTFPTFAS